MFRKLFKKQYKIMKRETIEWKYRGLSHENVLIGTPLYDIIETRYYPMWKYVYYPFGYMYFYEYAYERVWFNAIEHAEGYINQQFRRTYERNTLLEMTYY